MLVNARWKTVLKMGFKNEEALCSASISSSHMFSELFLDGYEHMTLAKVSNGSRRSHLLSGFYSCLISRVPKK